MGLPLSKRLAAALAAALALAALAGVPAYAEGPAAEGPAADSAIPPLDIALAEDLARSRADEVAARRAAAAAALGAVDAARSQLSTKLSGSLSSAYLVNPPAGVTVKKGSLASSPIMLPAEDWAVTPDAKHSYFKGNLSFSQPLFAWGKIRAAIDLASSEAEVASVDAKGSALDAARQAGRAYYSALLSEKSAAILKELRDLAAQIVVDRGRVLDEGLSTKEGLLSAQADLINNNLTPGVPESVTVALLASANPGGGACNAGAVSATALTSALRAWNTTLHAVSGGKYVVSEKPFSSAALSVSEFNKLTSDCGFIEANGSGHGICNSCTEGAAGAVRQ